jgi:hypothetical protein
LQPLYEVFQAVRNTLYDCSKRAVKRSNVDKTMSYHSRLARQCLYDLM